MLSGAGRRGRCRRSIGSQGKGQVDFQPVTVAPANSRCVFKSWSGAQNLAEMFVSPDKSTSSEVLSLVAQAVAVAVAAAVLFLDGLSHFSSHWQGPLEETSAKMCN